MQQHRNVTQEKNVAEWHNLTEADVNNQNIKNLNLKSWFNDPPSSLLLSLYLCTAKKTTQMERSEFQVQVQTENISWIVSHTSICLEQRQKRSFLWQLCVSIRYTPTSVDEVICLILSLPVPNSVFNWVLHHKHGLFSKAKHVFFHLAILIMVNSLTARTGP